MLRAVRDAREALIQVNGLSPLESWRLLHPPKYDALDNLYDCGGEDCPATGYGSKEDGALHHRRWAASHSSAASGHSLSTGSCDDSDYDGPAVPRGEQRTADDWARHAE